MSTKSKPFKACRKCKALVPKNAPVCPVCGSQDFTLEWSGVAIIIDPNNSRIAKVLEISKPGKYVVKLE